jgi:hypothetical protein
MDWAGMFFVDVGCCCYYEAAIDPGNSGGPAFADMQEGTVAGGHQWARLKFM